jgi:multisubunit Na+/H+ antiporter MnhC subunit
MILTAILNKVIPAAVVGFAIGTWIRISRENKQRLG